LTQAPAALEPRGLAVLSSRENWQGILPTDEPCRARAPEVSCTSGSAADRPVFFGGGARPNARFQELCESAGIKHKQNVRRKQNNERNVLSRADGSLFGVERTLNVVRDHQHEPAHKIVDALYRAARAFGREQPQQDDITAVVMKVDR
jgi:hypothetical protein